MEKTLGSGTVATMVVLIDTNTVVANKWVVELRWAIDRSLGGIDYNMLVSRTRFVHAHGSCRTLVKTDNVVVYMVI